MGLFMDSEFYFSTPLLFFLFYCSFVATFEIRKYEFYDFALFQMVLAVWEPLQSHDSESWIFHLCKESILLEITLNL